MDVAQANYKLRTSLLDTLAGPYKVYCGDPEDEGVECLVALVTLDADRVHFPSSFGGYPVHVYLVSQCIKVRLVASSSRSLLEEWLGLSATLRRKFHCAVFGDEAVLQDLPEEPVKIHVPYENFETVKQLIEDRGFSFC